VSDLKAAGQWEGLERPYWTLETYKLPTCKFME
jgi:protein arginine N-methyltransferase 2